jgi:hypothetical protein
MTDQDTTAKKVLRRGTPFTIYFEAQQMEALNALSKERHVSKATIVRLAVQQLLQQFGSRQIPLQLGIEAPMKDEGREA